MLAEKAAESVQILVREIDKIRSVKQWAEYCFVSRSCLKSRIRKRFGKYPKKVLQEIRYEIICHLISKQGITAQSARIAYDSGLGASSDALYKFLSRHFDTTFSQLKHEILVEEKDISFLWLVFSDKE
jgi:methylphosphotriester-DNA--protein-cysteine methyltransferase